MLSVSDRRLHALSISGLRAFALFILVGISALMVIAVTTARADDLIVRTIPGVIAPGTKIETIKDGFTGTEGPIALPDGSLIFTETQANRITKIAVDGSTSTFLENSNGANGLGFNSNGELIAVQVLETKVGVIYPPGRERVLANNFDGKIFGRPNDVVVTKQGDIYFTDSGAPSPQQNQNGQPNAQPPAARSDGLPNSPIAKPAVYHVTRNGKLERIADDIERPNGIQLSPDEKILYVANTLGAYVLAYDIDGEGNAKNRRNFAKLAGYTTQGESGPNSGADGLAVDKDGRLFVASNSGLEVFNAKGEALGIIALPKKPQNLAFAGTDKKTLYVVGRGSAYKIATLTAGFAGRAK